MKTLFDDREFAAGASASLNKTITAMMNFLEDDGKRPSRNFRGFLYRKIADANEYWYRRGFNRGHRESFACLRDTGKIPNVLKYECTREFFTNRKRDIEMNSRLRRRRRP